MDPWGLAVQPDRFEQQLAVVRRTRYPLPMSEFVSRLERGTLPDKAVAVTFDDGYVDNLHEASRDWRPRVCRRHCSSLPASSDSVRSTWWDELARGILLRDRRRRCRSEGRAADFTRIRWR